MEGTVSIQECSAPGCEFVLCAMRDSVILRFPGPEHRAHLEYLEPGSTEQHQGHRCHSLESDIKQTKETVEEEATERERNSQGVAVQPEAEGLAAWGRDSHQPHGVSPRHSPPAFSC